MIHAMTFTDPAREESWHTRDDWGLALTTQPTFNMPPVKTHILELPGGDGVIDLTTAITGYPVYGNRTGSFTFVAPVPQNRWQSLISQIAERLHGQRLEIRLDDDPGWYYEGRAALNVGACDRQYGTIVVDYDVGPYKWAENRTDAPWLWDPFSFVDGVIGNGTLPTEEIYKSTDLLEDEYTELEYTVVETGQAMWSPSFKATGTVDMGGNAALLKITYSGTAVTYELVGAHEMTIPGLTVRGGRWWYAGSQATVSAAGIGADDVLKWTITHTYSGADAYVHIALPAVLEFPQSGAAPVTPTFTVTGDDSELTVQNPDDQATLVTEQLADGEPITVPGLVLYRGQWLYDGHPAVVTADTDPTGGTATLSVGWREGKL